MVEAPQHVDVRCTLLLEGWHARAPSGRGAHEGLRPRLQDHEVLKPREAVRVLADARMPVGQDLGGRLERQVLNPRVPLEATGDTCIQKTMRVMVSLDHSKRTDVTCIRNRATCIKMTLRVVLIDAK